MDLRCTSQSSWLSLTNFTMALVSVWFIRSSRPLVWGWYAELILWSVPHNLNSSSLTLLTNSRPWSDITISATPYLVIRSYRKSATPRGPINICLFKQVEFKPSLNFDRGLASFLKLTFVSLVVACRVFLKFLKTKLILFFQKSHVCGMNVVPRSTKNTNDDTEN